jgi:hypothetical protein
MSDQRRPAAARPVAIALIGGGSLALAASFTYTGGPGFAGIVIFAALGVIASWQVRHQPLWLGTVLSAVLGFVLLNRGFGYVGLPIGRMPLLVGEIAILIAVATMPHRRVLRRLRKDPMILWLGLWLTYGCWALLLHSDLTFDVAKDASLIYYPVFLYFGFAASYSDGSRELVLRLFGVTFLLHMAYLFGFPWDTAIQDIAPRVMLDLGLFGHYNTAYVHVIGGASFFLILGPRVFRAWPRGAAIAVSTIYFGTLIFVQSRAGVLGAICVFAVLVILGCHRRSLQLAAGICALAIIVGVAGARGFSLQGWKAPATLDFLTHMVSTTFGAGDAEYASAGLDATRESRFQMWRTAVAPVLESASSPPCMLVSFVLRREPSGTRRVRLSRIDAKSSCGSSCTTSGSRSAHCSA